MTSSTSPEQLQQLLDIASEAALDGGAVLSSYWDKLAGQVEEKGRQHRSEEHTSELQSLTNIVCRLLLEKKK